MNIKNLSFALTLAFAGFSQTVLAENAPATNVLSCLQNHQIIHESIAQPGEYKVIYGPYTAHCATLSHRVQLRSKRGMRLPVTIEQLRNGNWERVITNQFDPGATLGTGTFRVILDMRQETLHSVYKGYVKIPL